MITDVLKRFGQKELTIAIKTDYSVTRCPSNDWNNIMETVTLDGTYSEQIRNEVWTALEHMQDYSNPWIVIEIKDGKINAAIYPNEEAAKRKVAKIKKRLPNTKLFYAEGKYRR